MAQTETLHCINGDHSWERDRKRGVKPKNCPKHQPEKAPVKEAIMRGANHRMIARIDAVWDILPEPKDGHEVKSVLTYCRNQLAGDFDRRSIVNRTPSDLELLMESTRNWLKPWEAKLKLTPKPEADTL